MARGHAAWSRGRGGAARGSRRKIVDEYGLGAGRPLEFGPGHGERGPDITSLTEAHPRRRGG